MNCRYIYRYIPTLCLPCTPDTISTTSSYTIRVAALSGSRSRLMEENTRSETQQQGFCINRQNKLSIRAETYQGIFLIFIRQNKSRFFYTFYTRALILSAQNKSLTQQTVPLPSSFLPFTPLLFRAGKRDNPIGRRWHIKTS